MSPVHPDRRPDLPLYGISVAAQLTGVNPAMLRAYESRGLIDPHRTQGGTRRYSEDDLASVRTITLLLADGLNLAGVTEVFRLEAEVSQLRAEIDRLRNTDEDRRG